MTIGADKRIRAESGSTTAQGRRRHFFSDIPFAPPEGTHWGGANANGAGTGCHEKSDEIRKYCMRSPVPAAENLGVFALASSVTVRMMSRDERETVSHRRRGSRGGTVAPDGPAQ